MQQKQKVREATKHIYTAREAMKLSRQKLSDMICELKAQEEKLTNEIINLDLIYTQLTENE